MDSSIIAKTLLTLGVGAGIGYFIFDYRQRKLIPNPEDRAAAEIEEQLLALDNEKYNLDEGLLRNDYLTNLPTRYRI